MRRVSGQCSTLMRVVCGREGRGDPVGREGLDGRSRSTQGRRGEGRGRALGGVGWGSPRLTGGPRDPSGETVSAPWGERPTLVCISVYGSGGLGRDVVTIHACRPTCRAVVLRPGESKCYPGSRSCEEGAGVVWPSWTSRPVRGGRGGPDPKPRPRRRGDSFSDRANHDTGSDSSPPLFLSRGWCPRHSLTSSRPGPRGTRGSRPTYALAVPPSPGRKPSSHGCPRVPVPPRLTQTPPGRSS